MKQKIEYRNPDDLHDHPSQAGLFGNVPDDDLAELAADMTERGQQIPVEILPDGTIITEHQRVRAARLLQWEEIDVIVRHDLEKEGEGQQGPCYNSSDREKDCRQRSLDQCDLFEISNEPDPAKDFHSERRPLPRWSAHEENL